MAGTVRFSKKLAEIADAHLAFRAFQAFHYAWNGLTQMIATVTANRSTFLKKDFWIKCDGKCPIKCPKWDT